MIHLRAPHSTVPLIVLNREIFHRYQFHLLPQVKSCKCIHSFIHLVIPASTHSPIHPNRYTSNRNGTQQKLRQYCRGQSGMGHTQTVGNPINCCWPQVVLMEGGCDSQADWFPTEGSKEGVTRDSFQGLETEEVQRFTYQYSKTGLCKYRIIWVKERCVVTLGRQAIGSRF